MAHCLPRLLLPGQVTWATGLESPPPCQPPDAQPQWGRMIPNAQAREAFASYPALVMRGTRGQSSFPGMPSGPTALHHRVMQCEEIRHSAWQHAREEADTLAPSLFSFLPHLMSERFQSGEA